ncbi:MAG: peptide ABC transporter substrate-binding protein, partial [Chloroflexaceae bacterium]|nr:peptide ABC transporter substrate-binding protein [Chloroflexaceae bacterium]
MAVETTEPTSAATDTDASATSEPDATETDTDASADSTTTPDDTATSDPGTEGSEIYTTPHPILSDVRVRQAIAYCANRLELIESVYPTLSEAEREELLMDTFLPRSHWAYTDDGITVYPFDPEKGQQLLEEAGWTLPDGEEIRVNADGDLLSVEFLTTDAQFRQTWSAVLEQQLRSNCGIDMVRNHTSASFVFGADSGLNRREFELAGFAWVGSVDPKGRTLYACDQSPLPSNNWEGQNYMGWCNERASQAIAIANSSLDREVRQEQYGIVQQEFTKDMVSLPLFNRLETEAASNNLVGFQPNPTEYYAANIHEWDMADDTDTVVIGFSQEPTTLFNLTESNANTRIVAGLLLNAPSATSYSYDYQPAALTQLPTIENGGATLETVEVQAGDMVWSADGQAIALEPGVEVVNVDNETVPFEGEPIMMNQLSVTFEYV